MTRRLLTGGGRRVLRASLLTVLTLVTVAAAHAEPPPSATPEGAWAGRCAASLDVANAALGRRFRRLRGYRASALPPINRAAGPRAPGTKASPAEFRAHWSASADLQPHEKPEHFYVDVGYVVDHSQGFVPATDQAWSCKFTQGDRKRRDAICVQRLGDRYGVARAITWGAAAPVDAFVAAFKVAVGRCLADPVP